MEKLEKVCSKCKKSLPTSDFNRNAVTPDGLQRYCRECHKAAANKSIERNRKKWSKTDAYTGEPYEVSE